MQAQRVGGAGACEKALPTFNQRGGGLCVACRFIHTPQKKNERISLTARGEGVSMLDSREDSSSGDAGKKNGHRGDKPLFGKTPSLI